MTESELIQSLESKEAADAAASHSQRNGICTLVIGNRTPSGWNVTILNAGANFYYRDGTSDTDGPRNVNLQAGQTASFRSKKAAGCVYKIFYAMKVVQQGHQPQDFNGWITDVDADQCMIHREVFIEPARSLSQSDVAAGASPLVVTVS